MVKKKAGVKPLQRVAMLQAIELERISNNESIFVMPSEWQAKELVARVRAFEAYLAERAKGRRGIVYQSSRIRTLTGYDVTVSGCWEHRSKVVDRDGYALISYCGKRTSAHRAFWREHRGEIPAGIFVCHRCDNRKCCNPDHLFLGTHLDNMADMRAKGRSSRVRPKGQDHASSVVTTEQVIQLRREYGDGKTLRWLAEKYGISRQNVGRIVARKAWKHVA